LEDTLGFDGGYRLIDEWKSPDLSCEIPFFSQSFDCGLHRILLHEGSGNNNAVMTDANLYSIRGCGKCGSLRRLF